MATKKRPIVIAAALLAATLSIAAPALAENHPERKWLVKDSEHFSLHYYPGIENTSERLLRAAEEAYPKLAADFGVKHMSQKIPIIITQDSFFNGEAEPMKDRITLDPVLANSSVIGTQRFVAHELAHVMTFASVDTGNKMAKLSNVGGLPTWFMEGIAQYEAEYWYPSNDRMLRLCTLDGTLLTDTERDNFRMFGVYSGAAGYNEGYSICRYMFDTYGRDKVGVLMASLKDGKHTFEQGIASTFGQNLPAIIAAWHVNLKTEYRRQVAGMDDTVPGATKLVSTAQGEQNVQPRLSPDGKRLAYLSSRYQDSFLYLRGNVMGFLSLYIADLDGGKPQMVSLPRGSINNYGWSADSKKLVYSRVVGDANGNPAFDLFVYDTEKKTNERLTTGEMANTMAWRPGTSEVLYVAINDGKNTIKLIDVKTKKTTVVLEAEGDTQFIQPAWSKDGKRLALVTHQPGQAGNLVTLIPETGQIAQITPPVDRQSDKDPNWTPDGAHLIFTSDRGGMTNLYQIDLDGQGLQKLTNTFRGAEMASIASDGKSVVYTSYRSKGSDIFRAPLSDGVATNVGSKTVTAKQEKPVAKIALPVLAKQVKPTKKGAEAVLATQTKTVVVPLNRDLLGSSGFKPVEPPATPAAAKDGSLVANVPGAFESGGLDKAINKNLEGDAKPYRPTMSNDMLMPQMTSDEKGQQVGFAGIYSDILDKNQLGFDVRYGVMSSRFSYLFQYTNNMLYSSWQVSLYDQPNIALSPDVGLTGQPVTDSLYFQRQRGAQLSALTPLGSGRHLFSGVNISTLSTLSPPLLGDHGQLREGQLNTLRLGLRESHVRQTVDQDINPSDGYALNLDWQWSDSHIGSAYNYSQYLFQGARYISVNPELRHNLAWTWNLGMINGDAPQPFLLGGANASNPIFALRGYAVGANSGNRLASTGLEYTLPIFQHIDKMYGPVYLDRLYLTGFTDVGSAWNAGDPTHPYATAGGEIRLKTSVMGRQGLTLRLGLAQKLGSSEMPGFYLTF